MQVLRIKPGPAFFGFSLKQNRLRMGNPGDTVQKDSPNEI